MSASAPESRGNEGCDYSVHAYVINLQRSPDRKAHVTKELSRTSVNFEISEAIDAVLSGRHGRSPSQGPGILSVVPEAGNSVSGPTKEGR